MNKKNAPCNTPHTFHGIQKLRCMSEIWHHKIQQRLSLDVPPRFNPVKAYSCDTGDLPRVAQPFLRRLRCMSERRQHVSRQTSGLVLPLHCTPNKKNTHDERNISAMQHITYTLKGVRSSDACLNLESHASAKTSLDVPPNLSSLKAKTVTLETGHTSHRHVFGGSVVSWSGSNTCFARDLTLFFLCTAHRT